MRTAQACWSFRLEGLGGMSLALKTGRLKMAYYTTYMQNYGYFVGGPHNKDCSIFGSISGILLFRQTAK